MNLNPTKARQLMQGVANAPTCNDAGEAGAVLLNFLLGQLKELRDLANGYPRNKIDGQVWFDGRELAEICDELTGLLARHDLSKQEELASRLAVGMACQVMGHYPEQIFPRVLRNARCREAIGEVEEAIGSYEAIIDDFQRMRLQERLEEAPLEDPTRTIVESVHGAASRLGELRPGRRSTLDGLQAALSAKLGLE